MNSFIKPEHIQGSAEWLAHRKTHIGASDAPIIMGESPWTTPYQLFEDKLGLSVPQEETYAMKRGTEMEPFARAAFELETGLEVFPQVVYSKENPAMLASLDGLSLDRKTGVEIKCPGAKSHQEALDGNIPSAYRAQLQHQMYCADLAWIWYYSFDGDAGVSIRVERDDKYIETMIKAERKFWECVMSRTSPELTEKDYERKSGFMWENADSRIPEIDEQIKILTEEKALIRKSLIADSGQKSWRCGGLTISRTFPRGAVDYSTIPELEGVDLDLYRKPSSERWTMRTGKLK